MPGLVWLASASPRRRVLLEWAGFEVKVHPANIDESRLEGMQPGAHAAYLAARKARTGPSEHVVLGADTVVHIGNQLFEKPADRAEALAHLTRLSGATHQVTTGVALRLGERQKVWTTTTEVCFRPFGWAEAEAYLATGEADDKAGAYGIQGRGAAFVSHVKGSWTNVVGLPLESVIEALREMGCVGH
jgi:septum formation protein